MNQSVRVRLRRAIIAVAVVAALVVLALLVFGSQLVGQWLPIIATTAALAGTVAGAVYNLPSTGASSRDRSSPNATPPQPNSGEDSQTARTRPRIVAPSWLTRAALVVLIVAAMSLVAAYAVMSFRDPEITTNHPAATTTPSTTEPGASHSADPTPSSSPTTAVSSSEPANPIAPTSIPLYPRIIAFELVEGPNCGPPQPASALVRWQTAGGVTAVDLYIDDMQLLYGNHYPSWSVELTFPGCDAESVGEYIQHTYTLVTRGGGDPQYATITVGAFNTGPEP